MAFLIRWKQMLLLGSLFVILVLGYAQSMPVEELNSVY